MKITMIRPTVKYANPISVTFKSPFVLDREDGTFYMCSTDSGIINIFTTYSSVDLVNCIFQGQLYQDNTIEYLRLKSFRTLDINN